MRILFIVPYSSGGPSNRYRVEQYLPYLKKEGIECDIRPFIFEKFYKILYIKGQYLRKMIYFIQAFFNRLTDMFKLYKYDVVFIHREASPFGPPIFEWFIHMCGKPIIFDFDDAIFLPNYHPVNSIYRFLKFPSKVKGIIKMSSAVIVASRFLKGYATKFNSNVYIISTPIDTEKFRVARKATGRLIIGWIGSPTTAAYLKIIFSSMQALGKEYDFVLKIIGAGRKFCITGVKIENCNWQLEKEIMDLQDIDIGIYPLPDTLWTRGKAGFKAIQYMACGIPVIASPVGITEEIIRDGTNGFLAYSEEEWTKKISRLIEETELRRQMGLAGRETIEKEYSVKVNAPKYLDVIQRVYRGRPV